MEKKYTDIFLTKFLNNFNNPEVHKGLIIASPSKDDPNYFYHWIRDAGICMTTIFKLYEKKILSKKEFMNYFTNYITAEKTIQNLDTLTYLGEPKINVDLTPFNGPWGRPQNDSPALRCISVMKYYNFILKNDMFDYVDHRFFYNKTLSMRSLIKSDLEYISHNYFKPCFDLWEENYGYHFYSLMVQKKCLEEGAKIADMMLDYGAFEWYKKAIVEISKMLKKFYVNGRIISSFDENWNPIRFNDTSIVLAFLHTNKEPNSSLVFTLIDIMNNFKKEYEINNKLKYPLIGRYIGDKFYDGNPWVLTTVAVCNMLNKIDKIETFKSLFIDSPSIMAQTIINSLKEIHTKNSINFEDGLSEQIDKVSGEFISARDLTWSYSECLQYILEYNEF